MKNTTDLYYIGATIDNPAVIQRAQSFSDHVNGALGIDCAIQNERDFLIIPPFYATREVARKLFAHCWAASVLNRKYHPLLSASFSLKGLLVCKYGRVDIVYFEVNPRNRQQYFDYVDAMRAKIQNLGGCFINSDGNGKQLPRVILLAEPEIEDRPILREIIRKSYLGRTLSFTPASPTLFQKQKTGGWLTFSLNLDLEERP